MYIDREHVIALKKHGFCAILLSKKDEEQHHPDIGEEVSLSLDEDQFSKRGMIAARLVAKQETSDGKSINIYAAACYVQDMSDNLDSVRGPFAC